jgi:calcium/calmodulin-dependent protein kinase (CaM kinase) II
MLPDPDPAARRGVDAHARDEEELLQLSRRLLDAIVVGDWDLYVALCDPSLTCFEPEARGVLVTGLEFHRFYFRERQAADAAQTTLIEPEVRMLGADAAAVTYVRLVQSRDAAGVAHTSRSEETRIWQRRGGRWRLVHLHRSTNS